MALLPPTIAVWASFTRELGFRGAESYKLHRAASGDVPQPLLALDGAHK